MRTPLYDRHVALGAKIVDFAGWEMPLQYKGIIQEHHAVRNDVGIFDVSHMGRISVIGNEAEPFLDYLSTNKLIGKKNGSATYTVLPNDQGGSVDDVIFYKKDSNNYFLIVNAANRQKDLDHLKNYAKNFDVQIQDHYQGEGILAVQGPKALEIGAKLFPEISSLKPMHFIETESYILSGTGYTGAGGFEIYASSSTILKLWDQLLVEGQSEKIQPVGLGARDTLRLEMGYALYGHELNDAIAPNESVSAWTVHWEKGDFLGKAAMATIQESPNKRSEHGLVLLEKGIAREGCEVFKGERLIGKVTSGTYSPTLDQSIAIILAEGEWSERDLVEVQIRQNRVKAQIKTLPFVKKIK